MMHSQHRHSRSLTFDLFTFSNSPRPPLTGLYTTCIYKQYKGLTAVCKRKGLQCVWLAVFIDIIDLIMSPDDLNVDQRFFFPHLNETLTPQYSSFFLAWKHQILKSISTNVGIDQKLEQTHWQASSRCDCEPTVKSCWTDAAFGLWRPKTPDQWTRINMHTSQTLPWNENLSAKIS